MAPIHSGGGWELGSYTWAKFRARVATTCGALTEWVPEPTPRIRVDDQCAYFEVISVLGLRVYDDLVLTLGKPRSRAKWEGFEIRTVRRTIDKHQHVLLSLQGASGPPLCK